MLRLDALRLIAALGVVVFHFNRYLDLDGRWDAVNHTVRAFNLFVDLFFVVSGYVISSVYATRITSVGAYGDFVLKRVARLGPLHWATLAFYVVLAVLAYAGDPRFHDPARYDFACLAPNLLLVHAWGACNHQTFNFVSWSISAEWGLYLLFPALLLLVRRGPVLTAAVAAAWLALLFAASLLPGARHPFYEWTADFGLLRAVPGFLIGMLAFRLRARLAALPAAGPVGWTLLALFFVGAALGAHKGALLVNLYAAAVFIAAGDASGRRPSAATRALAPFGQLTYSLYMLHPLMLSIGLNLIGGGMLRLTGDAMRLWVLGCMVVLFPLSYLSLMLFERPARRWISTLRWRPAPGAEIGRASCRERV